YWENVLALLATSSPEHVLLEEFRNLLARNFRGLSFNSEDLAMAFSKGFANVYQTVRKLEAVVSQLRGKAKAYGYKVEATPEKEWRDEYGFYVKNQNGDYLLYFGIWLSFCEETGFPLCLAIDRTWPNGLTLHNALCSAWSSGT